LPSLLLLIRDMSPFGVEFEEQVVYVLGRERLFLRLLSPRLVSRSSSTSSRGSRPKLFS
jgi:hypothetical protein